MELGAPRGSLLLAHAQPGHHRIGVVARKPRRLRRTERDATAAPVIDDALEDDGIVSEAGEQFRRVIERLRILSGELAWAAGHDRLQPDRLGPAGDPTDPRVVAAVAAGRVIFKWRARVGHYLPPH